SRDHKIEFSAVSAVASIERERHCLEVTMRGSDGFTYSASAITGDLYSSIDPVVEKLEVQLRRYKEKLTSHSPRQKRDYAKTASRKVLGSPVAGVVPPPAEDNEADDKPDAIIFEEKIELIPMSVDEAIEQFEALERPFWLFLNEDYKLNVLYRRHDGHYGLIEPEL
ncbi:MAG TPA: HPF/RaiA family ribosome-associated protein, partial [bacterium]|nr:HPF/RaiA family ribosome-associated protein [bacterium]